MHQAEETDLLTARGSIIRGAAAGMRDNYLRSRRGCEIY